MRFTLDSNILLYAVDLDGGAKRDASLDILLRGRLLDMVLCSQVLGEFLAVMRRKQLARMGEAISLVERWSLVFPVQWTGQDHVLAGARLSRRYKLQYWDSVIIAVAAERKADLLLSEDMQDGATIDGVTILNPFLPKNRPTLDLLLAD